MQVLRSLALAGCLTIPLLGFAQKEDWLPITPQDLQIKEVPGNPGASAIQLYFADYIDDDVQTEFFYQRIKILNDKGKQYADVEIEIPPDGSVAGIKARTIHPDGSIVDFNGKPFQKTLIKGRGIKFLADTFTMPEVTPGSIVEYKYKVTWPFIRDDNYWPVQHNLYTVKESLRMHSYSGPLEGFENGYQVSLIAVHMPPNLKPRQKGSAFEMEAENMPALDDEGYMPPADDYMPQVHFFYLDRQMTNPDKFWEDAGKKWYDDAEHFIGSHKEIAEAASQAIGAETDPEKKLRALYARAQKVRNRSYEHEVSRIEAKKEKIKEHQSVADVLARDYGWRNEITRLFVALARAAGFEASIVRVSDRRVHVFNRSVLPPAVERGDGGGQSERAGSVSRSGRALLSLRSAAVVPHLDHGAQAGQKRRKLRAYSQRQLCQRNHPQDCGGYPRCRRYAQGRDHRRIQRPGGPAAPAGCHRYG
jgi:hypothetical protein